MGARGGQHAAIGCHQCDAVERELPPSVDDDLAQPWVWGPGGEAEHLEVLHGGPQPGELLAAAVGDQLGDDVEVALQQRLRFGAQPRAGHLAVDDGGGADGDEQRQQERQEDLGSQ